jgi:hypothetical protein
MARIGSEGRVRRGGRSWASRATGALALIGTAAFWGAWMLQQYLGEFRPIVPNLAVGRSVALRVHGIHVFVTRGEWSWVVGLFLLSGACALGLVALHWALNAVGSAERRLAAAPHYTPR